MLVASILDLIATESRTVKIQSEVELLSAFQSCKKKPSDTADVFANIFKTCIARYINHSTVSSQGSDQQWAVRLLRNALLTPDTLNAIPFQLTTGAVESKNRHPTVILNANVVKEVTMAIIRADADEDSHESRKVIAEIMSKCEQRLASADIALTDNTSFITLKTRWQHSDR